MVFSLIHSKLELTPQCYTPSRMDVDSPHPNPVTQSGFVFGNPKFTYLCVACSEFKISQYLISSIYSSDHCLQVVFEYVYNYYLKNALGT